MPANLLIVDTQTFGRDLLATLFKAQGFECMVSDSASDALNRLREKAADLIILEMDLPGMSGVELISQLRQAPGTKHVPIIILSDSKNKADVIRAAALGIHGYLLKSQFSMERLESRVRELLMPDGTSAAVPGVGAARPSNGSHHEGARSANAAAPREGPQTSAGTAGPARKAQACNLPRLLTREQTVKRLDHVAGTKTIAGVVAQVMALANSPDADLSDLVKVLESDPVLATRVMQLANSASSGVRIRIRSVEDAVRNIGVREIRNLAFSIGIFGAFPPNEADGFNTLRCWQHSFAVADLIAVIARERDPLQSSVNHLAGLCHDLGEILLRQHFAEEYTQILALAATHHMPVHEVENVALSIRHPELLSRLLSRIGLPQPVVHAIREYFERQVKGQELGMSKSARALMMADQVAHGMLLASSLHASVGPISRTEWRSLGIDKPPPVVDPQAKRNEILTATSLLARLPVKDEHHLIAPLLPRHALRIWYVRPETFVALDPLAFALSLTSDVTISQSPPNGEQWDTVDGLIAVGIRPGVMPLIPAEMARMRAEAGRPSLPMLLLAGLEPVACEQEGISLRAYPLTLEELKTWLGVVKRAARTVAAV